MKNEKEAIREIIKSRSANLIKLNFDRYFAGKMFPEDSVEKVKAIENEIEEVEAKIKKETDKPKKQRNMETVLVLDAKLKGAPGRVGLVTKLNEAKEVIDKAKFELKKTEFHIELEERLIKCATKCLKNPEMIYDWVKEDYKAKEDRNNE